MRKLNSLLFLFLVSLAGGVTAQITIPYAANGSFTAPPGVTEVTVECWGGGGRGGTRTMNGSGGGGGGGAYARSVLTVVPGNTYTVTVGAGSTGTGAGGDSWFSSNTTILAKGGNSSGNNSDAGATGGSAAACIGDVVHAGGNGADASGGNGGGGGSSAGSVADGNNATGSTGAAAPIDGGDGGNGKTGAQGNGTAGSVPGGGGGGAKRTSTLTRTGGAGAAGQVRITYAYSAGTCLAAANYTSIPDNGCAVGRRVSVQLPVSGLPSALGAGPGNAVLQRVEVIANHTYNRDFNIRLTSPGGQTRDLLLNRFGNGDNLGVPGTCPAQPLVLQDGGAALVNANTNNATGPYAPEQSLSGFTGDPNGTWVLFVCDNEAADLGNLRYVNIVFGVRDCEAVINGPATPGTACDDSDPTTVSDTWDANCDCVGQPNILYSISSGDFATNIWSYSPGGAAAGVVPNQHSSVVVSDGHTVSIDGVRQCRDLTVQSGGTLDLGTATLTVNGSTATIDGALTVTSGTLRFAGTVLATLSGAATLDLGNLTVDNTAGLDVNSAIDIRRTLLLNSGVFTANAEVRLVSNASGSGRLGVVGAGASYVGDLTVERYIPGGATNWRLLTSPVTGRTVLNWRDDFLTAGFPGSHHPNFSSGGQPWPSVRWYDETDPGPGINDGLNGVSGTGHALGIGEGFAVWSGDALGGTNAFVVDVTGPPTIAASAITLPLTWTNTGVPATDGWNLVGNPLPSAINFTAISRGSNVQNAYWIFNPANGNNATWADGFATNGASGVIQHSQGFWMRTNGADVTTTLLEAAKTSDASGGVFGGQEQQSAPQVRLTVQRNGNSFRDEALVVFTTGTPATDPAEGDAPTLDFAHPQAPRISTEAGDGTALAINRYGAFGTDIVIPVRVAAGVSGTHTITVSGTEHLGLTCLSLEDLITGTIAPLTEGTTYSFTQQTSAEVQPPRFLLHATAPLVFGHADATCFGNNDGAAHVELPVGAQSVVWSDAFGNPVLQQNDVPPGLAQADGLAPGNYQVSVSAACGTLVKPFTIAGPQPFEVYTTTEAASCSGTPDGALDVEVLGGTAPYTYQWSTGATEAQATGLAAGTYAVTVIDANGCVMELANLAVPAPAPIVGDLVAPVATAVGEPITFTSTAESGTAHLWDLGDGSISMDPAPEHTYTLPGTYTVTLTLSEGACSRTLIHEVSVYTTTGLDAIVSEEVRAFSNGEALVLLAGLEEPLHIHVYDATGRVHAMKRMPAGEGRLEIPTQGWATGLYFLNARGTTVQWTFSLPVTE